MPKIPWKSNSIKYLYWVVGRKFTLKLGITWAWMIDTIRTSLHFGHPPFVKASGKYDNVTPCITLPLPWTAPFGIMTLLVGINLAQTLFDVVLPPAQLHPFYTSHWSLHPSPLTVLPSSQAYSYLFPSPQIYSHIENVIVGVRFIVVNENPEVHWVQVFSSLQLEQ